MSYWVVVVDDDLITTEVQKQLIIESGLSDQPLSFKDGKEFMDALDELQKNPDKYLVFLDINMPTMDAWQVMDQLTEEQWSKVKVYITTSSTDQRDKERARQYRIDGYIEKPLTINKCMELRDRLAANGPNGTHV
ncbi:MAG: response regulator [Cyclobacteriaceae bacterium]|nr:response regulator [Cyclobacteriaceae bacterium SS2]